MDLQTFLKTRRGTAVRLARAIGVDPAQIRQWAAGRPVPVRRCAGIETATQGAVKRWSLRPDDWFLIWPELTSMCDAPALPAAANDPTMSVNEAA